MKIYTAGETAVGDKLGPNQAPAEEESIRQLLIHKQDLEAELRNLLLLSESTADTAASSSVTVDFVQSSRAELHVKVTGQRLIYAVAIFAEGVFLNGESHVASYQQPKSTVVVALRLIRQIRADLHLKILIGSPEAEILQVVHSVKCVPAFALMKFNPLFYPNALSFQVRFRIQERIQRVSPFLYVHCIWQDMPPALLFNHFISKSQSKTLRQLFKLFYELCSRIFHSQFSYGIIEFQFTAG